MRMYKFSLLPGGHTRVKSSAVFTWKFAENQSRASLNLGSRRSSYRRNIRFTCSFVTSPMFPPLVWIVDLFFVQLGKRIFVRAGAVNRGHGNIQHPQIDGELPAMVIVMVHEDRANEPDPWDRHQDLSVFRQGPRGGDPGVVHLLQRVLRTLQALGESVQNLLAALGFRLRKVRRFHAVRHRRRSDAARHGRNVQRQLAQGKGFRVRFPGEFVFRNSIQDPLRRSCFLINFHQHGIYKSHDFSFRLAFRTNLTTAAVNPPAEITLLAISTVLPMQNGHIIYLHRWADARRDAAYRERAASARFLTPAFM